MVRLDNTILNPSLIWVERFHSSGVSQTTRITLGGRPVVNAANLVGGRAITLIASQTTGWLTEDMRLALMGMAAIPGKVMALTYHDDLLLVPVIFKHDEPPALELQPLRYKSTATAGDFYIGTIKLMQV